MTSGSQSKGMPPRGSEWLDSFSVVGTGALARSLLRALIEHGLTCLVVHARTEESARSIAALLPEMRVGIIGQDPVPSSDVTFVVVSDDAVTEVATLLAASGMPENQVVLHTSGVHASDALQPLADAGAAVGSFHPLQTFTGNEGKERFKGITIGVEGSETALRTAHHLADDLLAMAVTIPSDRKALYHAAAVMAGNNAIAMLATAADLWERATTDTQGAHDALGPLTMQSVTNALRVGPEAALTGPVVRGDIGTLQRHLEALQKYADHLVPMYAAVVTETVHLAMRSGRLSTERAVEMLDVVARDLTSATNEED